MEVYGFSNTLYKYVGVDNKMNKKTVIIASIIALIIIIIGIVIFADTAKAQTVKKQLEFGNKYMSEGKYEEAILAFEQVIKIDAKNVKAYIQLSDIYIKQGKKEEAIKLLKKGYELTKADAIKLKLDEIEDSPDSAVLPKEEVITKTTTLVKNEEAKQEPTQSENNGIGGYPNVESGVKVAISSKDIVNNIKKLDENVFMGVDVSTDIEKLPEPIKENMAGAFLYAPYDVPVTIDSIELEMKHLMSINYDFKAYESTRTIGCSKEGLLYVSVVFLDENNKIIGIYYKSDPIVIKK
jgi:tetratricopeptide (TPR) repeat protein